MKKLSLAVSMLMVFAAIGLAQGQARTRTFRGAIMDSACAAMGNHDAGYNMTGTHTPKDCTLACVKSGSTFVLYNAARKTTYKLDNQDEPRSFAGESVRVVGTYDRDTKTIHVEKMVAAK